MYPLLPSEMGADLELASVLLPAFGSQLRGEGK
jgi:hypothetical protein